MAGKEISRRNFILSSLYCFGSLEYLSIESKLHKFRLSEKTQIPIKELDINNNVSEILSLTPIMSFDRDGNLTTLKNGQTERVVMMQTDHDLKRPQSDGEKMKNISLMVHHFDDASVSNSYTDRRTAATTVNGLNNPYGFPEGASTPTVHWCIDSYPIDTKGTTETGYGILQTQRGSGDVNHPNHGQHVTIGINLATGAPDVTRLKTASIMENLNINSKLSEANKETTYFNSLSLGFEQTGTRFSKDFPNNFPENRQTANVFGLCLAVSKQYNLGPWDNVGHHEIQEKTDPGDEYMALIRYLYGVSSIAGMINRSLVFGRDSHVEYFNKTKEYFIGRAGQERYNNWNNIYGMDNFIDSLNPYNSGNHITAK